MPHPSSPSAIPDSLRNFRVLPPEAFVRLPTVKALLGCSDSTVWRMVSRGDLPAPRKISARVTAWQVGALRETLAARNGQ